MCTLIEYNLLRNRHKKSRYLFSHLAAFLHEKDYFFLAGRPLRFAVVFFLATLATFFLAAGFAFLTAGFAFLTAGFAFLTTAFSFFAAGFAFLTLATFLTTFLAGFAFFTVVLVFFAGILISLKDLV